MQASSVNDRARNATTLLNVSLHDKRVVHDRCSAAMDPLRTSNVLTSTRGECMPRPTNRVPGEADVRPVSLPGPAAFVTSRLQAMSMEPDPTRSAT